MVFDIGERIEITRPSHEKMPEIVPVLWAPGDRINGTLETRNDEMMGREIKEQ
jgi:hypothetical protein